MDSNIPIKQTNSLFRKIKNFFRNIFFKNQYENVEKTKVQSETENNKKRQFEERIKSEINNDFINEIKREELLDQIGEKPELLYDLPIEKLEKIKEYYKESIKEQKEKLAMMKNNTSSNLN